MTDRSDLALADQPMDEKTLMLLMPTLPERYEDLADIMATIKVGKEMGIGEMMALSELYIVNGSISMSAKLAGSLAKRAGYRFRMKYDITEASVTVFEPDGFEIGTFTFTMEDAVRAKLANKGPYQTYPGDMLLNKALARAVRFACGDAVLGTYAGDVTITDETDALPGAEDGETTAETLIEVVEAEVVDDE